MANRTDYLDNIRKRLGSFAYEIKLSGKVNRLGENISAEDIACGLLNLIFDYSLENVNQGKANQKAIDLADSERRVAVQISSSNTKKKVTDTLNGFCDGIQGERLCDRFDTLIVLILSADDKFPGWDRVTLDDTDLQIINFVDLSNAVEHVLLGKLREVSNYLDEQFGDAAPFKTQEQLPTHLLPRIPPATLSFVEGSRDGELAKLIPAVASGEPVYIWGLGGIGKTQVAIQLAKRMKVPKGTYFLHYTLPLGGEGEAMRETILQASFSDYHFQGNDNVRRDAEYQERMDILRSEYAGALLIIDNFDWPGKTLTDLQKEAAFRDLTRAGLKLVFTTRYAVEMIDWNIGPISDEALLALMRKSYKDASVTDGQLLELIHAVKGHTLMVDLMSKTLARSRGRVTTESLLEALRRNNLNQVDFPDVMNDRNGEHSQQQIYAHLRALFDLSDIHEEEQAVLRCATLLPEDGMDYNFFRGGLLDEQQKGLDRLVDAGWLQCYDKLLIIHPVVREVCRTELSPAHDDFEIRALLLFLDIETQIGELRGKDIKEQLRQFAKLSSIGAEQFARSDWAARAGSLWSKVGALQCGDDCDDRHKGYEEALECHLKARDIYKQNSSQVDVTKEGRCNHAKILYDIGVTYCALGDHKNALKYGLDALEMRKRDLPADNAELAMSHSKVGYTYRITGEYKKALEHELQALDIMAKRIPVTDLKLVEFYDAAGETYSCLGDYISALICRMKALVIMTYACPENDPELMKLNNEAIDLFNEQCAENEKIESGQSALIAYAKIIPESDVFLAKFYDASLHLGRTFDHDETIERNVKALRVFEKVFPAGHPKLAPFYEKMAETYGRSDEEEKELEYHLKVLDIWEKTLEKEDPKLENAYNTIGQCYRRKKEYEKELKFRMKALAVRESQITIDYSSLAKSYDSVARVYSAMEKWEEEIVYRLKALSLWEQVRPNHPLLARSYIGLGDAYMDAGEYDIALQYYSQALTIQEERLSVNHVDRGISYFHIGLTYVHKQNLKLSLEYFEKAVYIWEKTWPSDHPYVECARRCISDALQRLDELEENSV